MALVISEARCEAPELLPGELIFAGCFPLCCCPPRGVFVQLNSEQKIFIAHPLLSGCGRACKLLSVRGMEEGGVV
jgi:hypothetical protein